MNAEQLHDYRRACERHALAGQVYDALRGLQCGGEDWAAALRAVGDLLNRLEEDRRGLEEALSEEGEA